MYSSPLSIPRKGISRSKCSAIWYKMWTSCREYCSSSFCFKAGRMNVFRFLIAVCRMAVTISYKCLTWFGGHRTVMHCMHEYERGWDIYRYLFSCPSLYQYHQFISLLPIIPVFSLTFEWPSPRSLIKMHPSYIKLAQCGRETVFLVLPCSGT